MVSSNRRTYFSHGILILVILFLITYVVVLSSYADDVNYHGVAKLLGDQGDKNANNPRIEKEEEISMDNYVDPPEISSEGGGGEKVLVYEKNTALYKKRSKIEKITKPPNPKVFLFTFSNRYEGIPPVNVSASALGIANHLHIEMKKEPYTTHVQKMYAIEEHVNFLLSPKGGAKNSDILIFIDFFDAFFTCGVDRMLKVFFEYNCQLLIGAEKSTYDGLLNFYKVLDPKPPTVFRYLNSGVQMGYIGAFQVMYEEIMSHWTSYESCLHLLENFPQTIIHKGRELKDYNDQRCYHNFYLYMLSQTHNDFMKIDHHQKLVSSMHMVDYEKDFSYAAYDNVTNKITKQKTCIMHGHGNGKQSVDIAFNVLFDFGEYTSVFKAGFENWNKVQEIRNRDLTKVYRVTGSEFPSREHRKSWNEEVSEMKKKVVQERGY